MSKSRAEVLGFQPPTSSFPGSISGAFTVSRALAIGGNESDYTCARVRQGFRGSSFLDQILQDSCMRIYHV
jgi:hypothetical protein